MFGSTPHQPLHQPFVGGPSWSAPRGRLLVVGWACSSARLERTPDKREVGSSSLPRPTSEASVVRPVLRGQCCWSPHFRRRPSGAFRPIAVERAAGRAAPREGALLGGISSVGRAPGLQLGGHRFEPGILQSVPGAVADPAAAPGRRRSSFPTRLRSSDTSRLRPAVEFGPQPFSQRKRLAISRCM